MNTMRAFLILAVAVLPCAADSLFSDAVAKGGTLISDKRAQYEVGDIIVVIVRENIDASTSSGLNTKKESDVEATAEASANQFFIADGEGGLNIFNEEELPNWKVEVENEHKG